MAVAPRPADAGERCSSGVPSSVAAARRVVLRQQRGSARRRSAAAWRVGRSAARLSSGARRDVRSAGARRDVVVRSVDRRRKQEHGAASSSVALCSRQISAVRRGGEICGRDLCGGGRCLCSGGRRLCVGGRWLVAGAVRGRGRGREEL
jgi:hypothetical protein